MLIAAAWCVPSAAQDLDKPQVLIELKIVQVPAGGVDLEELQAMFRREADDAQQRPPGEQAALEALAFGVAELEDMPVLGRFFSAEAAVAQEKFSVLSAPRLIAYDGQLAAVSIGQAVPYMVQRPDGSLVVERSDELTEGLSVEMKGQITDDGGVTVTITRFKLTRVVGRQPIADVPFEVGRPVLHAIETSAVLRLGGQHAGVIRLPREDEDDDIMLVLVRAQALESDS